MALRAAPTESTRMKVNEAGATPGPMLSGHLTLANDEYISSGQTFFRDGADRSHPSVAVGIDLDQRRRMFGLRFNGSDQYIASERWNYIKVFDAAIQWRPRDLSTFSLGRKKDRWDEWEGDWHQGVFQPRYMINKLRSEQAGLAGVFYNQDTKPVAFAVGFLPLNVPDLGAHFYTEDDKFVSQNPWFNPPAVQFEYRQVVGDIHYSLDQPTLREATAHMGGVAKIELNGAKNYFGRLAFAYKPMPQFLLGFPSRNRVFVTDNADFMNVRVTPRLAYHALFSHDSVVQAGDWTLAGSIMREVPDKDVSREDFTAQQVSKAWITSASISRPLEQDGPYATRVKVAFLKVDGGDAPDKGDFANARSTLFERRYQFNEAYSLALSKPWRGFRSIHLDTEMRLVYDRLQNGGIASFSAGMNFSKEFRAQLEVDFLGLLRGPAQVKDGFLALYRANDRIGLGLSYVY